MSTPLIVSGLLTGWGSLGLGSTEDLIVVALAWIVQVVLLIRWARRLPSTPPR